MIQYRRLQAHEAEKLIRLVQRCYGDSYPMSLFYDPEKLEQKLKSGLLISAVAEEESSADLIGHVCTMWEYEKAPTADAMTGMILEEYQRQGILAKLTATLGTFYPPSGLTGLQLYAVTTHTASQRNGLERGTVECGFLLPEFPSTMDAKGVVNDPLGQCNPAVVMYRPLKIPPLRRCYVTPDYREMISVIYERMGYPRELVATCDSELEGKTEGPFYSDPRKGVDKLCLSKIGSDWDTYTSFLRSEATPSKPTKGWYIDVPLTQRGAIALTDQLRSEGWFFGAIIFERQEGDYLRMQYCKAQINRPALQIASDFGAEIADFVFEDRDCLEA